METNMQYQTFNKTTATQFRTEFNELMAKYGQSANLDVSIGTIRFTDTEISVKMTVKIKGAKSLAETKASSALEFQASRMNLTLSETMGRKLLEYNSRRHKYPFTYLDLKTGKRFKTSASTARLYFGKAA